MHLVAEFEKIKRSSTKYVKKSNFLGFKKIWGPYFTKKLSDGTTASVKNGFISLAETVPGLPMQNRVFIGKTGVT